MPIIQVPDFNPFAALGIDPNTTTAAAIFSNLENYNRRALHHRHPDIIGRVAPTNPTYATAFPSGYQVQVAMDWLEQGEATITSAITEWGPNHETVYHPLRGINEAGVFTPATMPLANTPKATTLATAAPYANRGGYTGVPIIVTATAGLSVSTPATRSQKRKFPFGPTIDTPTPAPRARPGTATYSPTIVIDSDDDDDDNVSPLPSPKIKGEAAVPFGYTGSAVTAPEEGRSSSDSDVVVVASRSLVNSTSAATGSALVTSGAVATPSTRRAPAQRSGGNSRRNTALPPPAFHMDRINVGVDGSVHATQPPNAVFAGFDSRGRFYQRIVGQTATGQDLPATNPTARNHQSVVYRGAFANRTAGALRLLVWQQLNLPQNQRI